MALNPSSGLLVYTDGSYCNNGPGGWSWVAVDGFGGSEKDSGFVPPPTTNNRMEMQAQVEALNTLHRILGPCQLQVVSDSQYVVMGCRFPERARNVNLDVWDELEAAVNLHDYVEWRHIRGHQGVKWNEVADKLAVQARKSATWV